MLEIKNLTKNFGGLVALDNVTFTVEKKQIFGLIGPNGAGKTTIFEIITGFLPACECQILLNGDRIDKYKAHQIASRGVARTFQNIRLFNSMTVSENIKVAQNMRTHSGISSLFRVGGRQERQLKEKTDELLNLMGLWEKRNEQSPSLSYGEQRRLEITRAMALDPEILLLDEPAAGMNETESEDLLKRIYEIRNRGITVLMIEHDMKVVMGLCDRVAVLNFGCLIAEGTPKEIQSDENVIDAYLGSDHEEDNNYA
jgi:branched-chain amino acid transport system ATP-binding protein